MNKKIKIQRVVRTYPRGFTVTTGDLNNYLEHGYCVVMCNKIGECLEYIVEKEIETEDEY